MGPKETSSWFLQAALMQPHIRLVFPVKAVPVQPEQAKRFIFPKSYVKTDLWKLSFFSKFPIPECLKGTLLIASATLCPLFELI
jgi:hypothetical protein